MNPPEDLSRDELLSVLFAEMVMQQARMATIFLGKAPHPQTGKTEQDLDAAKLFIDQLEMLEVKTKGNLTKDEDALLKQSLSHLRLSYVEAVNQHGEQGKTEPAKSSEATAAPAPETAEQPEEPRKRFTKKY